MKIHYKMKKSRKLDTLYLLMCAESKTDTEKLFVKSNKNKLVLKIKITFNLSPVNFQLSPVTCHLSLGHENQMVDPFVQLNTKHLYVQLNW